MKLRVDGWYAVENLLSPAISDEFTKAVLNTDEKTLIRLFRASDLINMRFKYNTGHETKVFTPLEFAAIKGTGDILQLMIGLGASVNPNFEGEKKSGPLRAALDASRSDNVQILLANGAECSSGEDSVLLESTQVECFQLLFAFIDKQQQLHHHPLVDVAKIKIARDKIDSFKIILDKITDDKELNALLKVAVDHDEAAACELLLQKITQLDNEDLLFYAVEKRAVNSIAVLCRSKHIDVNKRTDKTLYCVNRISFQTSLSALFFAIHIGYYKEAIQICNSASDSVNVNEVNEKIGTPLLLVLDKVCRMRADMFTALISIRDVDVTLCDNEGNSPLNAAISACDLAAVQVLLPRIDGEVYFNPDLMEAAVNQSKPESQILKEVLKHPKANVSKRFENKTLLNFAVLAKSIELVMQLLSRDDIDVNHNLACMTQVFKDNPSILMAFLLHDDINMSFFISKELESIASHGEEVRWILQSRNLLNEAVATFNGDANKFKQLIIQSYKKCSLVTYNRVINMIKGYKTQKESSAVSLQFRVLTNVLMNFPIRDQQYTEISAKLGEFLSAFPDQKDFDHQDELAVLFLLNSQNETNPMLISSLFKLAGVTDMAAGKSTINELLSDSTTRPLILKALATANYHRALFLDSKPTMCEKFIEVYYEENPNSLSLMWDITRWYASEHTLGSESAEQEIANIINLYEQFIAKQKAAVTTKSATSSPKVAELVGRSLSADVLASGEIASPSTRFTTSESSDGSSVTYEVVTSFVIQSP